LWFVVGCFVIAIVLTIGLLGQEFLRATPASAETTGTVIAIHQPITLASHKSGCAALIAYKVDRTTYPTSVAASLPCPYVKGQKHTVTYAVQDPSLPSQSAPAVNGGVIAFDGFVAAVFYLLAIVGTSRRRQLRRQALVVSMASRPTPAASKRTTPAKAKAR
jgi:hypothetical protein